jgi:membrane fusion protein, multidrug efflux system
MKRIRFSIALILAVSAFSLTSCNKKKGADQKAEVTAENVRVITLESKSITRSLEFQANTTAWEEVKLVPASPGRIEKIYVEVGSRVKAGQILVQMDQTNLRQAQMQIENSQNDYKRYETLHETGAISQQSYDQTKTQLSVQKNNLSYLENNTRIRAPFSGVIAAKNYENGELYSGAQPILTIVQMNELKAYIDVPESYYPVVKKGMRIEVKSDIYEGKTFSATISNIAPTMNASSHSFQVELKIPNSQELLTPGMFIRATLSLGQAQAVMVPYMAVLKLQGSNERYVFLEKNGKAERITVELGQRFDDQVELVSDQIKQGDNLVVAGQAKLKQGSAVQIVK